MALKRGRLFAATAVAALVWSGLAAAEPYRPGEFLNLDLSKAVLSPRPLGPATSFTPGPLDVTVDHGNNPAQASAELVVDPKAVSAETIHTDGKSVASSAPTSRTSTSPRRVAHARIERPAPRKPRTLVALHGRNPIEAHAEDTEIHTSVRPASRARIQVWPCKSGGICNWKR